MSLIHKFSDFSIAAMSILALAMFGVSLIAPLPSYGQPSDSQDSPVVKIPQGDWYYRWGDSPVDDNGTPLWTYQDASSSGWKPMGRGRAFRSDQRGQHYLWLMIQFPRENWQDPNLLLPLISQNVEVYQDGAAG